MVTGLLAPAPAAVPNPVRPAPFAVLDLGRIAYLEAWALQRELAGLRATGRIGDTLLLAEHEPAFCTGVLGKDEHLLLSEAQRAALGIPYYRTDRGGDVMYVGPGQVVAYPILRLADFGLDPVQYLRQLEAVVVATLADFGIQARRLPGLTGVWVGEEKIAGVAARVARGVTTHGFNLNVDPDLRPFDSIVTCGNRGRRVTSMQRLRGAAAPPRAAVAEAVVRHFQRVFYPDLSGRWSNRRALTPSEHGRSCHH